MYNKNDLRRGFSAATVHDIFNLLSVLIFLPINWAYPVFEKITYEMVKDKRACEGNCEKQEFLKPYVSPYSKGIASYDKKVAKYISQNNCDDGKCDKSLLKSINSLSIFISTSVFSPNNFFNDVLTSIPNMYCIPLINNKNTNKPHSKISKLLIPPFPSTPNSAFCDFPK